MSYPILNNPTPNMFFNEDFESGENQQGLNQYSEEHQVRTQEARQIHWLNLDQNNNTGRNPEILYEQKPIDRYIGEQQRTLFSASTLFQAHMGSSGHGQRAIAPISTLPPSNTGRMNSPTLSQDPTLTDSTVQTPQADNECYPEQDHRTSFEPFQIYKQNNHMVDPALEPFPPFFASQYEEDQYHYPQPVPGAYGTVNPRKVQGGSELYGFAGDEGLGQSIGDSPQSIGEFANDDGAIVDIENANGDGAGVDAEFANDGGTDVDIENGSEFAFGKADAPDADYQPNAGKSRRRARKPKSPTTIQQRVKRSRVKKATAPKIKIKASSTCRHCGTNSFKDAHSLQKHIASAHIRAYKCVFDFAGCASTFASKNEWKRHTTTQHTNLQAWVCDLGVCGKNVIQGVHEGDNAVRGTEFNRKDLFTQHLRRMHTPAYAHQKIGKNGKNQQWEDQLKKYQVTCNIVKREAPVLLGCPVEECDAIFEGKSAWDERMEHVGKHLEKAGAGLIEQVDQGNDDHLVQWALDEYIIEVNEARDGYVLIGAAGRNVSRAATHDPAPPHYGRQEYAGSYDANYTNGFQNVARYEDADADAEGEFE